VQEVIDLLHRMGVAMVVGDLRLELLVARRLQQGPLIGFIERGMRQSDLPHGRADVPDGPRLHDAWALPDAAELAYEGEEAAVAQAFCDRAVVEPAFVPPVHAPVTDELDDTANDNQLQRYEHRLLVHRGDEGTAERDQHRECGQQIGQHIGAAIVMREMHRQCVCPDVTRAQHVLEPLVQ
jgi:hypothetical protein